VLPQSPVGRRSVTVLLQSGGWSFIRPASTPSQPGQHAVPAGRRRRLEQQDHALAERLEVEDVVEAVRVPDVHEEGHAEDGVDEHDEEHEHDEEQQEADVEERRQRDGQREQQRPDALGGLDQSQDATDAEDTHDAQQGRRHVQLGEHVGHGQTCAQHSLTQFSLYVHAVDAKQVILETLSHSPANLLA